MPALRPVWVLVGWCLLNLVQAALTPLDPDETYYWMYAQALDWGYFDHPPAVALLIAAGKDWLPAGLGLRLGHVLTSTALLVGMYYLLDRPRGRWLTLAAGLVLAQPMVQVYGFIATPDGPLLLGTVLYLLAYRAFLRRPSVGLGLVWGLTMALLLYGKYHGVVLILFSVLPHLGYLLRQPGSWVAAGAGLLLYAPHLYWQYAHDYPSFRYHLRGRDDAYQLKYTLRYLLNQLVIFSPLLLYYYVRALREDHAHDRFERACRWLIGGVLLFFLYTTSKGGTEAQWTALLSIPLVYLTYRAVRRHPDWLPGVRRMAYLTIGLLLLARIALVLPRTWLPFRKPFDHGPWVRELATTVGNLPLMVENSYRLASIYQFYSGKPAWTFTTTNYRPNQYDLWARDSSFHRRTVYLLGQANWDRPPATPFRTQTRDMLLDRIEDFQVIKGVRLRLGAPLPDTLRATPQADTVALYAHSPLRVALQAPDLPIGLFAMLEYPDGERVYWPLEPLQTTTLPAAKDTLLYRGPLRLPKAVRPGPATVLFGMTYRGMRPLREQLEAITVVVGPAQ